MRENKREPVGKKLRFEVFKRDKFTCQYCGAKAPDVVLHVDHIQAVAEGGKSEILNLVTACQGCNAGKGARRLDDMSVIERQRLQIEELEERRQQLEMMLQWRDSLNGLDEEKVTAICDVIATKSSYVVNESGKQDVRKWLKKFPVDEILDAVDTSFSQYLRFDGDKPDDKSWNVAFSKVPAIAGINRESVDKPYLPELFYIQGILRNRLNWKRLNCVGYLEDVLRIGVSMEDLYRTAIRADDWDEFDHQIDLLIVKYRAMGSKS